MKKSDLRHRLAAADFAGPYSFVFMRVQVSTLELFAMFSGYIRLKL
jgi:hypothetical protein